MGLPPQRTNLFTNPSFETASGTVDVRTNLATNPSFESGSGTVTVRTNLAYDPRATATGRWSNIGGTSHTRAVDSAVYHEGTTAVRYTLTGSGALGGKCQLVGGVTSGETVSWSIWVYPSVACSFQPYWERTSPTYTGTNGGALVTCPANTWTKLTGTQTFSSTQADPSGVFGFGFYNGGNAFVANDFFVADEIIIEKTGLSTLSPFFTGASAAAGDFTYAWSGTVNDSSSLQQGVGFPAPSGQQDSSSIQSTQWSDTRAKSMRSIPRTSASATWPGGSGMAYGMQVGKTYTVSAKLRLATPQTGTLSSYARRISIHKQAGALVTWSDQAPNTAGVHSLSVTFTVPSDATAIYPVLYNGSAETDVWWDSLLVEETPNASPYFDGATAAAGDFTYAWTGTADASTSLQQGAAVTGFVGVRGALIRSAEQVYSRGYSGRLIASGEGAGTYLHNSGSRWDVTAGEPYTLSLHLRRDPTVTKWKLTLNWYDAAGVLLLTDSSLYEAVSDSAWTRLSLTATAPAGAVKAFCTCIAEGTLAKGVGTWFDDALFEKSSSLGTYFDGASTDTHHTYAWTGAADASTSTEDYYGMYAEIVPEAGMPRTNVYAAGLGGSAVTCRIVRTVGLDDWTVPGWRERSVISADVTTDWHVPLGVPVRYTLHVNGQPVNTYTITVPSGSAWVCDPLQPDSAMPVNTLNTDPGILSLARGSIKGIKYDSERQLERPSGSRYPLARVGQRSAGSDMNLSVFAHNNATSDQFRALVSGAPILLFKVLPSWAAPTALVYMSAAMEETQLNRDRGGNDTLWSTEGPLVAAVLQPPVSGAPTYDEVQTNIGTRTYASIQSSSGSKRYVDIQASPLGLGS